MEKTLVTESWSSAPGCKCADRVALLMSAMLTDLDVEGLWTV